MKILSVYPSVFMKITCPNCGSEGTLKTEKPPEADFTVSCPKCNEKFLVKIEIRKFYRKEVSIPIKYTLSGQASPTQETKTGKIVDISMEGLCIECSIHQFSPEFHKEGNLYKLSFSLPPRESLIKVDGKVINIRMTEGDTSFKVGVNFSNLDHFSKREIGFFLMP